VKPGLNTPRKVSRVSASEEESLTSSPAAPEEEAHGSASRLRRDAALAVATGFAVQSVLVVTGPLLARMLGPSGRGYLAALILWPLVITQLGNLGIPSALTYSVARDPSTSKGLARLGLSFALPQALILTGLQALWLLLILHGDPAEVRTAGWLTLALVPAMLAQQYGLGLLQGHLRLRLFNGLRLLPWLLYAIGVAALFVVDDHAIVPIVGALLAAFWISGSTALVSGIRCSRGASRPTVGRRFLVSFGLRGLLSSFSAVDVLRPDQVVLALFLSPSALGLYVVGLAFTNLPYFIAKSVGLITFPWVASRREKTDARRTMWSLLWLTTGIAVVIVAAMCATAHWLVPFFFGSQFDAAVTVTYIVLPGTVFLSARRVLSEGLKGRGYPLAGTVGELVSLAWIALALALFVPLWGIYGAAIALTSSYVVSMVLLVLIAARHGELESASGSLLSLPRDLSRAMRRRARPPEGALKETDRPAHVS
jgi:O-antigen/teichoic acid export membrane protein